MLITPANLNLFFTAMETRFWSAYQTAPLWHEKVATTYPVSTEQWVSGWIGMLNTAREWIGSRVTRQPAPQTYLVQIQNWELTEAIDQFKLMDDTYGIYYPVVTMMGMNMSKLWDYQLRDLLQNAGAQTGVRQIGIDGLTHWNTAHPVDFYNPALGTYSNDFRGGFVVNGQTVGGALTTNGFNSLWSEFASRKSESGEALGILANLTLVPPQLKAQASMLLNSQIFAPPVLGSMGTAAAGQANAPFVGAMDNPLKGYTDLEVCADIANQPTTWYMMDTSRPIKPFSLLLRQAPNFIPRITPEDPVVFDTHTYLYGSMARGAPAWSFPWLSAISSP